MMPGLPVQVWNIGFKEAVSMLTGKVIYWIKKSWQVRVANILFYGLVILMRFLNWEKSWKQMGRISSGSVLEMLAFVLFDYYWLEMNRL